MDQILSYTRRPGATRGGGPEQTSEHIHRTHTQHAHTHAHTHNTARLRSFTESVQDVGDEDELAGVEQDDGRVRKQLGALRRRRWI